MKTERGEYSFKKEDGIKIKFMPDYEMQIKYGIFFIRNVVKIAKQLFEIDTCFPVDVIIWESENFELGEAISGIRITSNSEVGMHMTFISSENLFFFVMSWEEFLEFSQEIEK